MEKDNFRTIGLNTPWDREIQSCLLKYFRLVQVKTNIDCKKKRKQAQFYRKDPKIKLWKTWQNLEVKKFSDLMTVII